MGAIKSIYHSAMKPIIRLTNKQLLIGGLLILAIFTTLHLSSNALNLSFDESQIKEIDYWSEYIPFDMLVKTISGGVGDVRNYLNLETFQSITGGEYTHDSGNDFINVIMPIFEGMTAVGKALLIFYFIMDIFEKMTTRLLDLEEFIRMIIKYLIAINIITVNLPKFLGGILNIVSDLVDGISGAGMGGGEAALKAAIVEIGKYIADTGILGNIVLIIVLFVPWIVSQFLTIFIIATVYSRAFTVAVYAGFAPIGMANIAQDGFSGHGMRYFKKYMGACFQGAVIAFILSFGEFLRARIILEYFIGNSDSVIYWTTYIFKMSIAAVIVTLAEVTMIGKSQQLANDIVNV